MPATVVRQLPNGKQVSYTCYSKVVQLPSGPVKIHYFTHTDPEQRPPLVPQVIERTRGSMPLEIAVTMAIEIFRHGIAGPVEAASYVAATKIETEGLSPDSHEALTREILAEILRQLAH